ncbi:thiamine-phosphate kinase [Caulobacter sp. 17J80-11]|uniref:thiamine-phosphate kinase n=1 Tax=Caulobacter sp. 17J80-11 TaxID=2763502 RepID=UPI0016537EA3|nr:thiamine-phosphate kinase [Caulobacter sp. 17J80-11]MBC6980831.1 thiamine-phosphate kinase [Caulobacter sp. 17J80-11]
MSAPDRPDEFDTIARLFRPLTEGAPEARELADDAAVLGMRPGWDLVITKDALVEGVHFLPDDPLELVARKALRVNLSDLAAKGAEPFGYFLAIAWSARCGWAEREAFARGLREDQDAFGVRLLGGDTVSTPGPLTVSVTALGWVPMGRSPSRAGAEPGDLVVVTGTIGDGWLGLRARRGELSELTGGQREELVDRYRLPRPRTGLAEQVRAAHASIDISDGLVADLGHVAEASGVGVEIDLERLPLSQPARFWLDHQADRAAALIALATGGDDYEIAAAVRPEHALGLKGAVLIGRVVEGEGVRVLHDGRPVEIERSGWRHG